MPQEIYGDRLHQARVLRQRKLGELAELLQCSSPTMSKWERSRKVVVSDSQLNSLVENLRFNRGFFSVRPCPPMSEVDLLFKAPYSTPKREISWLVEFVRLLSELLDWLDGRRRLPPVKIQLRSRDSSNIIEAAQELRYALGVGAADPIDYLTHPVERAGIIVVVRRRSSAVNDSIMATDDTGSLHKERHEGCSAWIGEFRERPLVVMRGVDTWEKTRWVLAHELGHLSLHAGRIVFSDDVEEQASRFASELLAPIKALVPGLPRVVTMASLLDIKRKWGISLAALIRHLYVNEVITKDRRRTLYEQLYTRRNPETGRSFGVTEPGWNDRMPERPRLIAAWLERVIGSLTPEAIAATSEIFPVDLLASILSEQRPVPGRAAVNAGRRRARGSAKVIHLNER